MRKYYYWLVSRDPETGKSYIIYGGESEDAARQQGLEMLAGLDFEMKRLPTRDRGAASAFIRGKRLERTHSLKEAGQRMGHEKSVRRMRQMRRRQSHGIR